MAIFERGETYAHWTTIRDRNDQKVNPTSVKITISDPCGRVLVNAQNMVNSSTGVYYYNYDTLSSTATYGKYTTNVTAISGLANVGTYISHFYVMPWKVEQSVRQKMGITDEKDIDDDALTEICWMSYKRVLREIYLHARNEVPMGDPDTGVCFDGVNTSFQTRKYPIADVNGDGEISGTASCATDMFCWWIDSAGSRQEGYVTVNKPLNGEIQLFQSDGATPIPSTNEGVYVDYWYSYDNYDEFLFREAVSYLASHYVNLRLTERNKVTLADINRNTPIIMMHPDMFLKEYRNLLKKVSKPKVGGV